MTPLRTVRWGILGCGDVAEKKSGPALYRAQNSSLIAVMRRDLAKAQDFARRHGAKRAYDRAEDLLADTEVDAVYIATPPHVHCEQTIAAAHAGKHVLVEKPMAMNGEECDRMIAACRAAGVHLHVAYYRRFYPKFVHVKKLIDDGAIGQILGARLHLCSYSPGGGWRVDPTVSGGGHFLDVGTHRLDMLVGLLGTPEEIVGFADNRAGQHAAENDVVLALRMESGALVSGSFHFHTHPNRDVLEIYGTDGTIALDPFDAPAFFLRRGRPEKTEETFTLPTPDPVHLPFIEALVRVYRGESNAPAHVTGEEGAKATRIVDAALHSFRASSSAAVAAK